MMDSPPGLRPETRIAISTVERALELARRGLGTSEITSKGGRDLVTATDVAVEDTIRTMLGKELAYPVVGEERGGERPSDGSPYWLVDPICGTRNFASGLAVYCVNLALIENDRTALAVIGDESTGEIHVAERDGGAWTLSGEGSRRLVPGIESRTIVIDDSSSKGLRREHAARFVADTIRADRWHFRSIGSTVPLPYLAAGRISAYVIFHTSSPVHVGAGTLLVTEAGAVLTDLDGLPWTLTSDSLVASAHEDLHVELLKLARATDPGA